jgi:hypothetical protein
MTIKCFLLQSMIIYLKKNNDNLIKEEEFMVVDNLVNPRDVNCMLGYKK